MTARLSSFVSLSSLVFTLSAASAALVACDSSEVPAEAAEPQPKALTGDALVARGKYLVATSGCHDCHTPFKPTATGAEPDMTRALSGHPAALVMPPAPQPQGPWLVSVAATNTAWAGPWGVSFTANLTPDKETGLGTWTAQNFIDTLRNGRHMGAGRPILPPMPVSVYGQMSDEDLKAIFAYLQSVPAIQNKVPEPRPPAVATQAPAAPKVSVK